MCLQRYTILLFAIIYLYICLFVIKYPLNIEKCIFYLTPDLLLCFLWCYLFIADNLLTTNTFILATILNEFHLNRNLVNFCLFLFISIIHAQHNLVNQLNWFKRWLTIISFRNIIKYFSYILESPFSFLHNRII